MFPQAGAVLIAFRLALLLSLWAEERLARSDNREGEAAEHTYRLHDCIVGFPIPRVFFFALRSLPYPALHLSTQDTFKVQHTFNFVLPHRIAFYRQFNL